MKLQRRELGIVEFEITDTYLLLSGKNSFTVKDLNFEEVCKIEAHFTKFLMQNDLLILQKKNSEEVYIYTKTGELLKTITGEFYLWSNYSYKNNVFFTGKENGEKLGYQLDLTDLSLKKMPYFEIPQYCDEHRGVFNEGGFVSVVNFENGLEYFKIPRPAPIEGNIHLYNDILILPLNNGHLLALSALTGEKLWELDTCFHFFYLDKTMGLLYGYSHYNYQVISIAQGKKLVDRNVEKSNIEYGISPCGNMCRLSGNGLYFVSWLEPTKFGKVNIQTHEIEFLQELKTKKGVKPGTPTYHQGRLYILDTVYTLHVFEDEENKKN